MSAARFDRSSCLAALLALLACGVVGRTLFLQLGDSHRWSRQARQQQTLNLAEPPKRGRLLDRQGRVLVDRVPRFLLHWTPAEPNAALPSIPANLLSPEELARLTQGRSVPLDTARLPALTELVNRVEGLSLQELSARSYPHGSLACHVLGYVREEEIPGGLPGRVQALGVEGLEAFYDQRLRGELGVRTVLVSATGVPLALVSEVPPRDGQDLRTSLDLDLQKAAEQALGRAADRLAERSNRRPEAPSVALLMDLASGEMLAMASRPSFDPSVFLLADESVSRLLTDPQAPLLHRAIAGLYPPASTFKLFTSVAALRHRADWAQEAFFCPGSRTIGGTVFHCFVTTGHGPLSFPEAVSLSCDTVFYDLATRLPVAELVGTAREFGFGSPTGIDLPGESGGHLPDPDQGGEPDRPWYAGDSANLGIGQGYLLVTPLQLLNATAQLLRGQPVRPRLLGQARGSTSPPLQPLLPAWEPLWEGARGALRWGTAGGLDWGGLEAAGKTGTAEAPTTEDNPEGLNHTWLVAWAPADRPRVVALAFFEGSGGYGGEVAGPVVADMLRAWEAKAGASSPEIRTEVRKTE